MIDISSHPLLQQAYGVCQAIEQCGASPELTRAVGRASDLLRSLDDHLKRDNGSVPGQNAGIASDSVAECRLRDDQEARDEWWRRELSVGVFTVPREQARAVDSCRTTVDKLDEVSAGNPIQGEAMSFMIDPLEQAIESTARVLRDEHEHLAQISMAVSGDVPLSPVYKRMSAHLEALLSAQLKRVGDDRHQ